MDDNTISNKNGLTHADLFRLRFAYVATSVVALPIASMMLFAPRLSYKVIGFPYRLPPDQDPVIFGTLASIWLMVGVLCVFAARFPRPYVAFLPMQLLYKTCWLMCVALPLLLRGELPEYAWPLTIGNLLWIGLDSYCMPWRYWWSRHQH
ncbi:MAG: hypothetical protein AAFP90_14015 [Planctomycetota bacterium]